MAELERAIDEHDLQVLMVDPLYLCLLAGNCDLQASNLFDTGPLLLQIAQSCLKQGCTPILIHHTRLRNLATERWEPPALEDLAFSGTKEFARQWVMVGRREAYEDGTGHHALWLSVGGSAGHSGLWAIDIDEGQPGDDFTGRTWHVTLSTGKEARAERAEKTAETKQQAREAAKTGQEAADRKRLSEVLAKYPGGLSVRRLAGAARIGNERVDYLVQLLVDEGIVEACDVDVPCGNGTRPVPGVRLKHTRPHPPAPA